MLIATHTVAQPATTSAAGHGASPDQHTGAAATAHSDAALEIMPHAAQATPPLDTSPSPAPADSGVLNPPDEVLPALPTSGPPSSMVASSAPQALPYLGISVQRVASHSTPGRDVEGLEIVSVDPNSPADHAGLKGRGGMSKLGATGATAGALMAPLDIVMMPLLKKTGQLGQTGDLIVAIDDQRVADESDLETALANAKPGDTMYLTIVRLAQGGARHTIKKPVRLSAPVQSVP
jgi:hypothetical protein